MTFVSSLQPTALWSHFDAILTIPRASKDENRMRTHVVNIADRAGCNHAIDDAGNLVVRKPAVADHNGAEVTILQSHLDMVQEKNSDVIHDFRTDPIVPKRRGNYITGSGTTLGSDNGIGIATMLAIMETKDLVHGPLEFLFTIDEETGLTGASHLDASLLTGRRLINLDSEEEGILYVGCAGGGDTSIRVELEHDHLRDENTSITLALTGLKGGHSGCDIHLQRGNALCLLARALWTAYLLSPFHLARLEGGSAHNAIPREAFADLVVTHSTRDAIVSAIEAEMANIRDEYSPVDPDLKFAISQNKAANAPWTIHSTENIIQLLASLPHGVEAMNYDIPSLVNTSSNLATVSQSADSLVITTSSRSSIDAALEAVRRQIKAIGRLAGADVVEAPAYPGWKPNLSSPLLEITKSAYEQELGTTPSVQAIHAGLECGIIGKKIPGMDMISFGPIIEFPHSPDERVQIDSVGRFYRLLETTLTQLAS